MENMEVKSNGHHIVAQALETALDNLVEKEDGKGLSSNDYTDAEKEKLAGLENYTVPDFTYRNLCLNSRGDNLNCWSPWSGADHMEIDTLKFGRPVIKITNQFIGSSGEWHFGLTSIPNMPDVTQYIGTNTPLPQPLTISYRVWCNYAVSLLAGNNGSQYVAILPNQFQRVSHTLSAGTVIATLGFGVGTVTQKTDLEIYYEMMQVEWGTEATPYCYNPTLPFSLEEQIVPGEFWDGKQVYVRSFKGITPETAGQSVTLATEIDTILDIRASIESVPYNSLPPAMIYEINGSIGTDLIYHIYAFNNSAVLYPYGSRTRNMKYTVMLKYTKS